MREVPGILIIENGALHEPLGILVEHIGYLVSGTVSDRTRPRPWPTRFVGPHTGEHATIGIG